LPIENSLLMPSSGHSSQHVQPQAADMHGIDFEGSEQKWSKN